jgi:hypothetical protein
MNVSFFRLLICVPVLLFFFSPRIEAQNLPPPPDRQANQSRTESPYLLPQTIFVGDSGRLVVPLGRSFASVEAFVRETSAGLPESPDLVITRLELEHRGEITRLFIDFVPYAPGLLSFPPLEFQAGDETLTVTGLEAQVASILVPSQTALSEPVPPMAVPGTSLLVYGTAALVLCVLFIGIGGSLWSRRHFRELWERFRRRHLLRAMSRFLRRLEQEGGTEKKGNPVYYLTLLSGELREFLSLFTGINCRPLSAGEFVELTPDCYSHSAASSPLLTPEFLRDLFRSWDTLRFSGRNIDKIDLFLALEQTKQFIAALDRAEKERSLPKSPREVSRNENEMSVPRAEGEYGV